MLVDGRRSGPANLLALVASHGPSAGGGLFPDMGQDGEPVFVTGERIIWSGRMHVGFLRQRANNRPLDRIWELPEPAEVWLTDRRLVFTCKKFTEGDWKTAWMDWTEFLASSVNSIRAELKRYGRRAVGQIRYEWPTSIELMRRRVRMRQVSYLGVDCVDPWDDAIVRLVLFDKSAEHVAGLTRMIVTASAAYRLTRSLPAGAEALLRQQADCPVTADQTHPFGSGPGDSGQLPSLDPGATLTFPLPGAIKISGA
jgi:hypothetical protein